MLNFLKKFLDYNQKQIDTYQSIVDEINGLEDKAKKLKDADFKKETELLKEQIQSEKKTLDEIRPWAFAMVREAARRTLGLRHYDVQLIAGLALADGKISEQKTGEGKTLSATTALYLHALKGKGAHLVTVNDYLARRDAGWMGGIFHLLGLHTSAIIAEKSFMYDSKHTDSETNDWRLAHLRPISRIEAYRADVTYGINSEFGFDYLRDNMEQSPAEVRQREFYYAIIDEADSVLIDEARTPHIISAPYDQDVSKYYKYAQIVRQLDAKDDYIIDEKDRTANLTDKGLAKIEKTLGVNNVYEKDFDTVFHIEAALKAETLFKREKDYIVKDGEIIIVDEFTGRLQYGRRWSEGIHQAVEAKENVSIQRESKTLATISLQNYFRKYKRLAGMTGTASTEAEEFHKIYKCDVLVIPTHQKMVRKDEADLIYKTEKGKYEAVVEEVARVYKQGRPVLIGTTSIEKNELVSRLLTQRGIQHNVLNAKNHENEARIIAEAGKKNAVTVATNMAGRGVDIILGGDPDANPSTQKKDLRKTWEKEHDDIVELGGLYIIGTERHESRRIDNQLRGRAGRQGDPGETRFFVSLEDDLMRIFGGEQISRLMTFFNLPEDQPLTHSMVSKAIEQAQVKVEGRNFDIRKHLVEYDDVLNTQREIVYDLRRSILMQADKEPKEFKETVFNIVSEEFNSLVNQIQFEHIPEIEEMNKNVIREISMILPVSQNEISKRYEKQNIESILEYVQNISEKEYEKKEKELGSESWRSIVRFIFLSVIDMYLTEHLSAIDDLREGIGLRGYANVNPLVEYKNEAFSMFEKLMRDIRFESIRRMFTVQVEPLAAESLQSKKSQEGLVFSGPVEAAQFAEPSVEKSKSKSKSAAPIQNKGNKPGRNEPCWCGSGKKYKKCHWPN